MKKKKFCKIKEIKAIARERVGKVPARKIIKSKKIKLNDRRLQRLVEMIQEIDTW